MAKRQVKWTLDGTVLKLAKALEDPKAVAVIEAEFDLTLIYPTFREMNDVQQQGIVKGMKEKLSDSGASEKANPLGKIAQAKETWQELLDGKWKGERVNSTGAAEDRAKMKKIKEAIAGPVTLTSLILKQTAEPEKFTAEDQAKLDELMAAAVKITADRKKAAQK